MNKFIWMCWLQGIERESMPMLNKLCLQKWPAMNPSWKTVVLDNNNISEYVPEYFDILKETTKCRERVKKCYKVDILRLLLLSKYGGIWVDASVLPMVKLDDWIEDAINDTGFFAYRFDPRSAKRDISSWFLVANSPKHYLIEKWKERTIDGWKTRVKVPPMTKYLSELYDSDERIKFIINEMVQINTKIPHSASKEDKHTSWDKREDSYMYKRPRLTKEKIRQIKDSQESKI